MNQGMFDLIMRELAESRQRFDDLLATLKAESESYLMGGNGTLDEREHIEREFRDRL